MNNERAVDNKIFMNAVAGVALLLITVVLSATGIRNGHSEVLPALAILASGLSSITLLYAAIRKDNRLQAYSNMH